MNQCLQIKKFPVCLLCQVAIHLFNPHCFCCEHLEIRMTWSVPGLSLPPAIALKLPGEKHLVAFPSSLLILHPVRLLSVPVLLCQSQ